MTLYIPKYSASKADTPEMAPFVRHLGKNGALGHKIDWPFPNAKPISDSDFWHYYTIYSPTAIYHVGHIKVEENWASVVFFAGCMSTDVLLAIVQYYSGPKAKTVEYYQVSACDHEYEHKSGGNCYHIYTCTKCGHRYDVDSSD
jgi:hypothetical protein